MLLLGGVGTALAKVCLITDFGAIGDGITKATSAFEGAVKACSREADFPFSDDNKNVVVVPSGGTFITGSFNLASGVDLFVEQGAMILGSTELDDYPLIDILPSYGTGRDVDSDLRYQPLIFGQNLSYVSVSGDGIIDGNGGPWWEKHFKVCLTSVPGVHYFIGLGDSRLCIIAVLCCHVWPFVLICRRSSSGRVRV